MIIRKHAYPRAALIGNPSDGFFGKTIAFTFANFCAEVTLYESPRLEIIPSTRDHSVFENLRQVVSDVENFGYYGGIRLLKASVKRFFDYCMENEIKLDNRNFTICYRTTIPPHLGLAGSSAIITACFRALLEFYGVNVQKPLLANLILSVETEELGIPAGLQDRVAQVYDCPVFMDFDKTLMETRGHGHYEPLGRGSFPNLYVAYRGNLSQGSEVTHSNPRYRYDTGEPDVVQAMHFWSQLTLKARQALENGKSEQLAELMNDNFDMRRDICPISDGNLAMVKTARSVGASAKFTGSGGAIIGTYTDETMYDALVKALAKLEITVIKPVIRDEK
ncbi:MAG: GHMP kinase [Candidatus Pacebacteria bacterium]|nr:GHMP kinase [Candidatus Paceibacterota bacterium]